MVLSQTKEGIAAFGALQDQKIAVTFTFDHRIINGVDAAKFVQTCKEIFKGSKDV